MRLVYLALGWTAGIVLALSSDLRPLWLWGGGVGVALAAVMLTWRDARLRVGMMVVLAFTLGGLRSMFVPITSDVAQYNDLGGMTITGVVVAEPDVRDDRVNLRVRVETVTRLGQTVATEGIVLVQAPPTSSARYGDRVAVTGALYSPGVIDNFSYADFLARSDIYSLMDETAVEVLSSGHGSPFFAWLFNVKRRAETIIAANLPEPEAGLLTGILLGDERSIAPEVREAFQVVGASHIVAISGFNMVLLSGFIATIFSRIPTPNWVAVVVGLFVIGIYTIFVGTNAAVVRAAVMSSVLVISTPLRRRVYVPASLAFVVMLMSLQNPQVLWDVGFQLSLAATLGIVLFVPTIGTGFRWVLAQTLPSGVRGATNHLLYEPVVVTLAAQVTTLPLTILYFEQLSLLSLLVNLLIVPFQAAVMVVGGAATLVGFVLPEVAQVIFWVDLVLLGWTTTIVRGFARMPFAAVSFRVSEEMIASFFAVLILGMALRATQPRWLLWVAATIRRRLVFNTAVLVGASLTVLLVASVLARPDGQFHVWMLDVGHSNAVLMQSPGGAQILVDGGRFPSRLLTAVGDRIPFNDREIEVLVLTQPDAFQFGALPSLLARYDTGVVLTNGQPNLSDAYLELQEALVGQETVVVRAGYTVEFDDGLLIEVLHPQTQPSLEDNLDDGVIVLRVSYGDVSFLLTSDLSVEGQISLIEAGQHPVATVLQLPQHGTARSLNEDFLEVVQPQLVLLQSDRVNRRGDPDPDTLARLGDVPLFRTDHSGTLHVWTDGRDVWVQPSR